MQKTGQILFRWRSYLPLVLFSLVLFEMRGFTFFGGTERGDILWEAVCGGVSLIGIALRAVTTGYTYPGSSGRNTHHGQVASRLNTTGMYSVVRNPLYLGNFFIWMGVGLFPHDTLLSLTLALAFWLYYERIVMAEEDYLVGKFGGAYADWSARTPAFLPRWSRWVSPERPFDFKRVLRKENPTLFGTVACFFLLEVIGDVVVEGRLVVDPGWALVFGSSLALYVLLRALKPFLRRPDDLSGTVTVKI